jgi:hypothetical protein
LDKTVFAERLQRAAECTRDFARTHIIEPLPDAIRFDVQLNSSYDGNPLHPDERVYPDDPECIPQHLRSGLSQEEVVELLWREGAVPEWINLTVVQEADQHTLIEMDCCGRFTANEQLLYHARQGYPPFHVLGPPIPPSHDLASKERYSLNWLSKPRDRRALSRLRERAEHVQSLILSGPDFDDESLEELARASLHRLRALRLEGTRVRGSGLRHLVRSPLRFITWEAGLDLPLALQFLEPFSLLESLHFESRASTLEGLSTLSSLRHLNRLTLHVPALVDIGFLRPLESLEDVNLAGTRVGDSGLKHLVRLKLHEVDLRDTQVTAQGVAWLQRKCPELRICSAFTP